MGEKKDDKDDKNKKHDNRGKIEETSNTVLLKVDMHCASCASKIIKCTEAFQGIEMVKAKSKANKLTIVGKLNPMKLRDKLASKTKKKVDLISPQPKKENNANNKKDAKADNNKYDTNSEKKIDNKKLKEPLVMTTILKVSLHCQGCIERICKIVSNTKGIQDMNIDKDKELITVKGTMDVKTLAKTLQERLKRRVEVVPPKKENDKEKDGKGAKEGVDNNGGKKKKNGGNNGNDGNIDGGGGGKDSGKVKENKGEDGRETEQSRMELVGPNDGYGYGYGQYHRTIYMEQLHAPQMFSDENPNACSIM